MVNNKLILFLVVLFWLSDTNAQIKSSMLDSLDIDLAKGKYTNIDGIVLSQNGKIFYEKYFNNYHKDSLHDSRSSFKSITSLLIGLAIDNKFIKNVNEKVYAYFPEYMPGKNEDVRKKNMTIQNLLEMKSGFNCEEWNGTKDCESEMENSKNWVQFSLHQPLAHSPGEKWAYTSTNTMILSGILSKSSEMTVTQFADKFLFKPLEITNYRWTKDPSEQEMTAGSFYILPTDLLKIGELLLHEGKYRNQVVISGNWISESTKATNKIENFSNVKISKTNLAVPQPTYYGYGWYNEKIKTDTYSYNVLFASGNGGQYIMVIKELNLVAVFTGNSYNSSKSKLPFEIVIKYILPYLHTIKNVT
ncbi:serine hydrolase [Empedobacter brevis]|uniref:serine hydrolase domain-containing protein n=1 Tax=Empedobacter brevis TaxID=247 RepID=UPI00123D9A5F|nr:serine hydrolase [Empedobacter brevis]QES93588.1 serine hydrolase [Empedobacter brevis]